MTTFTIRDRDSGITQACEADSLAGARSEAEDWAREGDWNLTAEDTTIWVDVDLLWTDEDGDPCEERVTTRIDPPEPPCLSRDRDHSWFSPEWLGGCKENPGVRGHGGGVIITEACRHCGCARMTNTWAQRPDTGEQGLESIRYEQGRYAREVSKEETEETSETSESEA